MTPNSALTNAILLIVLVLTLSAAVAVERYREARALGRGTHRSAANRPMELLKEGRARRLRRGT